MKARKRSVLVPADGIEMWELRAAFYIEPDGSTTVNYVISDPQNKIVTPNLIEVFGVLKWIEAMLIEQDNERREKS